MNWGKEFLTGNYDILTRGWEILLVAEGPYPWLRDLTRGYSYYKLYYAIVTRGQMCVYMQQISKQEQRSRLRCEDLSINTKLQISNNARSKNITLR